MTELSRQSLFDFLEWAGEKGLMKKATAGSLRVASKAVLEVLEESECDDLSKIDLDNVFQRYANLNSLTTKPETMKVYRRRMKKSVGDFIAYNNDRANWKPSGGQRTRSSQSTVKEKKARHSNSLSDDKGDEIENGIGDFTDDVSNITHRFPLRQDVIVSITGIPFNVTQLEMGRLTAYISNLVAASVENENNKPMLNAAP